MQGWWTTRTLDESGSYQRQAELGDRGMFPGTLAPRRRWSLQLSSVISCPKCAARITRTRCRNVAISSRRVCQMVRNSPRECGGLIWDSSLSDTAVMVANPPNGSSHNHGSFRVATTH
jgi:hypothetical protein